MRKACSGPLLHVLIYLVGRERSSENQLWQKGMKLFKFLVSAKKIMN